MLWSTETPVTRGRVSVLAGLLLFCSGCGGGGATVPTVTFRPEAVEQIPAAKPAGGETAALARASQIETNARLEQPGRVNESWNPMQDWR